MEISGFFNAVRLPNGEMDRTYLAEFLAEYFGTFFNNGVFAKPSTMCQVMADGNSMAVTVKTGKAWINGYYYHNTDDLQREVEIADGVLPRVDRVVLRLDFLERKIRAVIKKGGYATEPKPEPLQRDADAYEMGIADIRVEGGVISITQAAITDLRLNTEFCGVVSSTIDQVDTTTLFVQYQDWFRRKQQQADADMGAWEQERRKEFYAWFNGLKEVLDENTATNLYQTKAERPAGQNTVLQAADWTGTGPYTITLRVEGVTATNLVEVIEGADMTKEQRDAKAAACIRARGQQADGQIVLTADGDRPNIDIPVTVLVGGEIRWLL